MQDQSGKPCGLTPEGERAYEVIVSHLRTHGSKITGELQAFWNPPDYDSKYAQGSLLVVMYDGLNDIAKFFSLDADYPQYKNHESMRQALEKAGFYADECTGYFSAVYARKP